jgi:hypothetical protein
MKVRGFVAALLLAGLALTLPPATSARPRCPTGPTCVPTPSICNSYCAQFGLIYDYCDFGNGCCYCTPY